MRRILLAGLAVVAMGLGPVGAAQAATTLSGSLTADNWFFAYVGTSATSLGTPIGSGNDWTSPFSLTPSDLTPGVTNYLNIEAINGGGPGGFSAVLNLSGGGFAFGNGRQTLTTAPSDYGAWSGSYNDGNSDVTAQPWVAATGSVVDANYGWGNVVGTDRWIWPSDEASGGGWSNTCQFCTVDFTVAISPVAGGGVPEPSVWAMLILGMGAMGAVARRRRAGALAAV